MRVSEVRIPSPTVADSESFDFLVQKIIEWALGLGGERYTRDWLAASLREDADLIEAGHYDYAIGDPP